MAWQQLTLHIDAAELPRTEALLRLAGAVSVAINDAGDSPILEPQPGTTPLWPQLNIQALFPDGLELAPLGAILGLAPGTPLELRRIDDTEVERAARQTIQAVRIGPRLELVPAEELRAGSASVLGLHMGLAFGTGQHPTTRLCLEWLERELEAPASVLDFGCGTGVLALAALKLGAAAATAVDNEPQALDATRRNAELNGLESRIAIGPPEMPAPGPFDLILANILAQPLIDLARDFQGRQPAGGRIVLSGILEAQLDAVAACYGEWYDSLQGSVLSGWGLLTGVRRSGYDR